MDRRTETSVNMSSDELHNQNCFDYIQNLVLPEDPEFLKELSDPTKKLFKEISQLKEKQYEAVKHQPFGNLLSQFLRALQNDHSQIKQYRQNLLLNSNLLNNGSSTELEQNTPQTKLEAYHHFLNSIYNNPNQSLARTYSAIKRYPETQTPVLKTSTKHRIQKSLRDPRRTQNQNTPAKEETMIRRAWNITAPTFMPQIDGTNLPYQIQYDYTEGQATQELHLGTQAQRIGYETRVTPLFQLWVDSFSTSSPAQVNKDGTPHQPTPITHLYINKLKYGQPKSQNPLNPSRAERLIEQDLSMPLHQLEENSANIVVLTLPADEGLMRQGAYLAIKPTYTYQQVFDKCIQATINDGLNDFYLSKRTQRLLFLSELNTDPHDETENEQLERLRMEKYNQLLKNSFSALGFGEQAQLSEADQQAVWFHFINVELTDFILNKLHPQTFNISCKDAIDRGAVSSAYLNLMRSFKTDKPLTRDDFDRALQTPAAMVKARGMNHHLNRIWNVIDRYVDANISTLETDPKRSWLIEWRDVNCPPQLANYLLTKRMTQHIAQHPVAPQEQEILPKENDPYIEIEQNEQQLLEHQLKIFDYIQQMHSAGIGDTKLLLTIFAMTKTLATHPDEKACERYIELANQLPSMTSRHRYIAGLMVNFVGDVLKLLRLNQTANKLYTAGEKLKKEAFVAKELKQTCLLLKHGLYSSAQKEVGEDTPLIVLPFNKQ